MKQLLEKNGKRAILLAIREVTSATLLQFTTIDAYVNTACPRIALQESPFSKRPILTTKEVNVALNVVEWETHLGEGLI